VGAIVGILLPTPSKKPVSQIIYTLIGMITKAQATILPNHSIKVHQIVLSSSDSVHVIDTIGYLIVFDIYSYTLHPTHNTLQDISLHIYHIPLWLSLVSHLLSAAQSLLIFEQQQHVILRQEILDGPKGAMWRTESEIGRSTSIQTSIVQDLLGEARMLETCLEKRSPIAVESGSYSG
jgi:hypothetical protein